jgi:hypothetical protein
MLHANKSKACAGLEFGSLLRGVFLKGRIKRKYGDTVPSYPDE